MSDSSDAKLHFLDYWKVIKLRWGIVLITFLAVVVTAGVTCFFLPRQYYSRVLIEVKPEGFRGVSLTSNDDDIRAVTDLRFAPTQMQIIRSQKVLQQVIENLDLIKAWSVNSASYDAQSAYNRLYRMVDVNPQRNTDVLEIGVYDTDPQEAANIANAVAELYSKERRTSQLDLTKQGRSQLNDVIEDQRKRVSDAFNEMTRIRNEQHITDLSPETIEQNDSPEAQAVVSYQRQSEEATTELSKLRAQLDTVDKMKPEQLMVGMQSLGIEDPTVAKILPAYQQNVAERANYLAAGLGVNHPKIKSLDAETEVFQQQLNSAIQALHSTLASKLSIAEGNLTRVTQKLADIKNDLLTTRASSAEYIQAKTNYIQEKNILTGAIQKSTTSSMQSNITTTPAKIWEIAKPARAASKPNIPAYMGLAFILGIGLGCALAFFIEYLDTSVKTMDDAEKFLGIPVLAVIPKDIQILFKMRGDSPDAEAYRILRTNLEFNRPNPDANTITLISGGPGEGKSTTLNNLAYTCAQGGYRVLVVDADLRRPSQHRLFEVDNEKGLSNYLRGNDDYRPYIQTTKEPNLSFMPSGPLPADAIGILNSQRMVDLIRQLKGEYDLVFFDSPPILGVSDGSVLASEVDMTMMVIQHRRFPRNILQRVKQSVLSVGGQLIGSVLNNVDTRHDETYQYYTAYNQYYAPKPDERDRPQAARQNAPRDDRRPASTRQEY